MRPGGGKQKGSEYERQICKALSLWVSHGAREDLFWRSAMSGGRATVGHKKGKDLAQHAGDISATHPAGHVLTDHFYVECKRYADLNFGSFLTKAVGPLAGFWLEAVKQAAVHDRIPMLIVRQDRGDTLMLVPNEAMLTRGLTGHVFNFAPDAWIARLMRMKIDIFEFELVVKKPFEAPAKYNIGEGSLLKPGELTHILSKRTMHPQTTKALRELGQSAAKALGKIALDDYHADVDDFIPKWRAKRDEKKLKAGLIARATQGDDMIGESVAPKIKRIKVDEP